MAELPDLGKHCDLESCRILDYTPFSCSLCNKFYCSSHRFNHGCSNSKEYDPTQPRDQAEPLKPFLCSQSGCSTAESIKIVCPYCQLNFCLKHRYVEDHCCPHVPKSRKEEVNEKMAIIREACGVSQSSELKPSTSAPSEPKRNRKLTESEKKKMDKVALMKLKLKNNNSMGPNEQLIVFVEWEDGRVPILIGKSWTIGRAVSEFSKNHSKFSGVLSVYQAETNKQLDYSDTCGHVLKEQDTIFVEEQS